MRSITGRTPGGLRPEGTPRDRARSAPKASNRVLAHRAASQAEVKIPRIIHRIWLGGEPLRDDLQHYGETWRNHHPGWEIRLWTDDDLPEFGLTDALEHGRHQAERADVLRYELLKRFGGVYVDIDIECLRSLEPLIERSRYLRHYKCQERVSNGILGAVPGHPLFERASREAALRIGVGTIPSATGPPFFAELVQDFPEVTLYGPEKFFPYLWTERHRAHEHFPEAYAVHHWWGDRAESWRLSPGGVPRKTRPRALLRYAPGRIRTCGPLLRRQPLCPLSYGGSD